MNLVIVMIMSSARRFDDAWNSVAKTLKNPGREVKSPTPKRRE